MYLFGLNDALAVRTSARIRLMLSVNVCVGLSCQVGYRTLCTVMIRMILTNIKMMALILTILVSIIFTLLATSLLMKIDQKTEQRNRVEHSEELKTDLPVKTRS